MKKKKIISILLAGCMTLSLAGCGSGDKKPDVAETQSKAAEVKEQTKEENTKEAAKETAKEDAGKLVIYTASDQNEIDLYISGFEAQTGIETEIVSAGTGELLKRIEAEAENPLADIQFGGTPSVVLPYSKYFEPYTSANEEQMLDSCKNVDGTITCYNVLPICMIVNTNLIGDIEINGYKDLLNPELKGKIAFVDPAQSSTGMQHLTNMLLAIGGDDEEKGWEFIKEFIANLDGKMISSSSAVGKGVADGEYVVGLTHEGYVTDLISDGYPVEAVYTEEGLLVSAGTVQIIKGCKNMENAKKFVDYVTSKEVQTEASTTLNARGANGEAPSPEGLEDIDNMHVLVEDVYHTLENTQLYLERFKDIYTD